MKNISLILKNIKYYFNYNKAVFLLFVIGIISNTILLIFLYGNLNPIKKSYAGNSSYEKQYNFQFKDAIDENDVESYIQSLIKLERVVYITSYDGLDLQFKSQKIDSSGYNVGCVNLGQQNDGVKLNWRNEFSKTEIYNAENVVIISESLSNKIGSDIKYGEDVLKINGIDYKIIGKIISGDSSILMPNTTYFKNGFETTKIRVVAQTKPSYYGNLEIIEKISREFDSLEIVSSHPYSEYDKLKTGTPVIFTILTIVFVAMSITFIFLLKHLADNMNYISIIQSICGATKETVVFIKLMTIFCITLGSSLIGIILHALTYGNLLKPLNIVENLTYSLKDYLMIIAIICLASVVSTIPFLRGFIKDTLISNKIKFS
ncbi:MAG: ABC transporter permease [Eubacteriales bacterium]|nr:ABC transporter permease [Eubacteriales bacterium]MDD4475751.1 ABC transporter permease [Eubacteriales bacterium]